MGSNKNKKRYFPVGVEPVLQSCFVECCSVDGTMMNTGYCSACHPRSVYEGCEACFSDSSLCAGAQGHKEGTKRAATDIVYPEDSGCGSKPH